MVNKLAKRLLLLLLLFVAAGLCIHAQQKAKYTVNPDNPNIIVRVPDLTTDQDEAFRLEFMNNSSAMPMMKGNKDLVTVTTSFDCDEETFRKFFSLYRFVSDDRKQYFTLYGYEGNTIELPKGKYDIIAQYASMQGTPYYVIREQVDITSDTTISTNPEEAQVHIKFQPSYPNGEICRPVTLLIHEDYSNEIIEEGNLALLYYTQCLVDKESGRIMTGRSGVGDCNKTGYVENDLTENSAIFVNSFSDRFAFTCSMMLCPQPQDGNYYLVNFQTDACKDSVITNDTYEYASIDVPLVQSPVGKENGETMKANVRSYLYDTAQPQQGTQPGDMYAYNLQDGETCRYSICNAFDGNPWTVTTLQAVALDGMSKWDETSYVSTYGQRFWLDNGKLRFLNTGIGSAYNINHYYYKLDESDWKGWSYMPTATYPGNPIYSYDCDKCKTITGNSCPILVPVVDGYYDYETGEIEKELDLVYFLGRNGEIRERDFFLIQSTIKVDGEDVLDDEQNATSFEWIKNADSHGVVDITITNDDVDVDGLPGKNVTNIHFDMANDDQTAPMLQMLDFRDTEDNAIDRFATAEEGKLQFYCGDFNDQYLYISSYDYYRQFFVCDDLASVEVAYSPYQADTWTALDANEVAEYYYDGMGHYYAAPLAGVTEQAEQGWFDLKIRLEDAAGNWQEQVISPAFRIDDLAYSSVATVGSGTAHEVARYTLDGRRVDANTQGVVIVKMSDGTAKKVLN